jgi:hypothetical protein
MREYSLTDGRAKEVIYDAFVSARAVMPMRMLDDVHKLYFDDQVQRDKFADRSLWSLSNAFTQAVKELAPMPQQRSGVEIGRYFGRVLHNATGAVVVPLAFDADGDVIVPDDADDIVLDDAPGGVQIDADGDIVFA